MDKTSANHLPSAPSHPGHAHTPHAYMPGKGSERVDVHMRKSGEGRTKPPTARLLSARGRPPLPSPKSRKGPLPQPVFAPTQQACPGLLRVSCGPSRTETACIVLPPGDFSHKTSNPAWAGAASWPWLGTWVSSWVDACSRRGSTMPHSAALRSLVGGLRCGYLTHTPQHLAG